MLCILLPLLLLSPLKEKKTFLHVRKQFLPIAFPLANNFVKSSPLCFFQPLPRTPGPSSPPSPLNRRWRSGRPLSSWGCTSATRSTSGSGQYKEKVSHDFEPIVNKHVTYGTNYSGYKNMVSGAIGESCYFDDVNTGVRCKATEVGVGYMVSAHDRSFDEGKGRGETGGKKDFI